MSRVYCRFDDTGEVVEYWLANSPADARLWRAVVLAPKVAVCEALLRGETVPAERLDPEWIERLGRRR